LLALPLCVPFYRLAASHVSRDEESAPLLFEPPQSVTITESQDPHKPSATDNYIDFSEMEDERMRPDVSDRVRQARLRRMHSNFTKAVAEGAVKVKRRRKGPRRGEDFTLSQALVKADFWLLFAILFCGAGSGLTAIDNLGQIGESQGFASAHIFVSLISIWSFLGRIGAGWASEIVAKDYAAPRPILLAIAQGFMALGHFIFAMSWPVSMYFGSLLVGFGYGCHWAIAPATASELFGIKNFGALYNVLTIALPAGSLIFSGLIAGHLYDREADGAGTCVGKKCFELTFLIMTMICVLGVGLNLVLVKRTYRVYQTLYGKHVAPHATLPANQPARLGSLVEEEEEASSSK
jgi:hypothetical protein